MYCGLQNKMKKMQYRIRLLDRSKEGWVQRVFMFSGRYVWYEKKLVP